MDEQQSKSRSGLGRILWLLVILAIVVLWWYFRGSSTSEQTADRRQIDADYATAITDPDDILVDLKDDATPDAIEKAFGIDLVLVDDSGEAEKTKLYRAHVDPAQRDSIIAQLSQRDDVEIAEPDAEMMIPQGEVSEVVEVPATEPGYPNDPLYPKQWHLRQIGMPEAWKLADGNGTIVAVLDTGVGYEEYKKFHLLPDLKGIEFVKPYNFVANNTHANDDHGHGSHVTGSIAQVTNNGVGVAGVARNVKIMPLKVLSGSGSGSVGGIADAIRFAADNGAKVMNMSLGSSFPSKVLEKAVKYAHDKGVTVVCAAGNESRGRVGYPAAYPGAIAVAATQNDEATTFYSNWGKEIDIAAPGGNTRDEKGGRNNPDGGVLQNTLDPRDVSKDGYYAYMGTSMASPHAAGVAALVVGMGVKNPDQVEKVLKATARKPANQKYDAEHYGAGIIDAPAAVKAAKKLADEDSTGGGLALLLGGLLAGAVAIGARSKLGFAYVGGVAAGSFGPLGNPLFASALIPVALLLVGYGVPKLRAVFAGLAIGVAGHLVIAAVAPNPLLGIVWLAANAVICIVLARAALRRA